jgi:Zn-dependent M28 family amino/carboxypeptidase
LKPTRSKLCLSPRLLALLACLAFALLTLAPAVQAAPFSDPAAITPDPRVQAMLGQVSSSALYTRVAELSGKQPATIGGESFTLVTRSTVSASYSAKATQYAYERFQALGLTVSYHDWQYYSSVRRNVIAQQPGSDPTCIYMLVAHIDSTSSKPETQAPGADDNASGTAGVLMAAAILSQVDLVCSVRYALFTGEEQGLLGSEAYAAAASARGDPIKGVLNLDMIAYNTTGSAPTFEMYVRSGTNGAKDRLLSTLFSDVVSAYTLNLQPLIYVTNEEDSDHASFWAAGYPAILAIEDWYDHTPYYHSIYDQVDTLNMAYFTEFVKAATGAMAHLAGLSPLPPQPQNNRIYIPLVKQY